MAVVWQTVQLLMIGDGNVADLQVFNAGGTAVEDMHQELGGGTAVVDECGVCDGSITADTVLVTVMVMLLTVQVMWWYSG